MRDNQVEPGILRTCRQTQREARRIFWEENRFHHEIFNLVLLPQLDHWYWKYVPRTDENAEIIDQDVRLSWTNLKVNLRNYYRGIGRSECEMIHRWWIVGGSPYTVCWIAFEMVDMLNHLLWSEIELILEVFRKVVDNEDWEFWEVVDELGDLNWSEVECILDMCKKGLDNKGWGLDWAGPWKFDD